MAEFAPSPKNSKALWVSEHCGEIALLKIQLQTASLGMIVSKPTVAARYDAVLDDHGKLYRAQVKYCNSLRHITVIPYPVT